MGNLASFGGDSFLPRERGCGGEKRGFSLDPGRARRGTQRGLGAIQEVEWHCIKARVGVMGPLLETQMLE